VNRPLWQERARGRRGTCDARSPWLNCGCDYNPSKHQLLHPYRYPAPSFRPSRAMSKAAFARTSESPAIVSLWPIGHFAVLRNLVAIGHSDSSKPTDRQIMGHGLD